MKTSEQLDQAWERVRDLIAVRRQWGRKWGGQEWEYDLKSAIRHWHNVELGIAIEAGEK